VARDEEPVHGSNVQQGMVRRCWGSGGTKISATPLSSCPHPWRGRGNSRGEHRLGQWCSAVAARMGMAAVGLGR
jgi:hypothetical protein